MCHNKCVLKCLNVQTSYYCRFWKAKYVLPEEPTINLKIMLHHICIRQNIKNRVCICDSSKCVFSTNFTELHNLTFLYPFTDDKIEDQFCQTAKNVAYRLTNQDQVKIHFVTDAVDTFAGFNASFQISRFIFISKIRCKCILAKWLSDSSHMLSEITQDNFNLWSMVRGSSLSQNQFKIWALGPIESLRLF